MTDWSQETLEGLIHASDISDAETRRDLAAEVGRRIIMGDRRGIPTLLSMLSDEDRHVAEAASDQLWNIGEPVVLPLIQILADKEKPPESRQWAARTLLYIPDGRAVQSMLEVVRDESDDVELRRIAARHLGSMRDPRVFETLVHIVTDDSADGEIRLNAAAALGDLQDVRATQPLLEVLKRPDVRVVTEQRLRHIERARRLEHLSHGSQAVELSRVVDEAESGQSLHHEVQQTLKMLGEMRPARTDDNASSESES